RTDLMTDNVGVHRPRTARPPGSSPVDNHDYQLGPEERMGRRSVSVCCLVLFWAGGARLFGQTFTGAVRGEVRDAHGVITRVPVTLTNEATNVSRETETNEVGQYNFAAVPPGTYLVSTTLTGFKTVKRSGLRLGTQQFLTVDLLLEPG